MVTVFLINLISNKNITLKVIMETPTQSGAQGQHLRRPYSQICAVQVGQPWAAPSLSLVLYNNEIETVHERSFSFHCLILVLPRTPCVCL